MLWAFVRFLAAAIDAFPNSLCCLMKNEVSLMVSLSTLGSPVTWLGMLGQGAIVVPSEGGVAVFCGALEVFVNFPDLLLVDL